MKLYVEGDEWFPIWIPTSEKEYKEMKSCCPSLHRVAEVDRSFYDRYVKVMEEFMDLQHKIEDYFIDSERND